MLTSCSIIFVLLSFLAGANACIQCPVTLTVENKDIQLTKTTPGEITTCLYNNGVKIDGLTVQCQYLTVSTFWILCSSLLSVDMLAMASEQRQICGWAGVLSG
ncbi:uncharacterized protein EDB91DRAFT_1121934 [Suillus paluster]|uniref:uncharacterized protein n=1 Tax=Suillus paluster TaxID=48578 RepID=UPI001B87D148|nr:uncharacterized protein EDB91DRAFT_1121934 [Suillus paluster]KAG1744976.1 hypothetical protein EDB91DRAFT_1121934 [Suillus paluster]